MTAPPRLIWHDGDLWIYRHTVGGFEGYRALFSRRRLAPDLRFYGRVIGARR